MTIKELENKTGMTRANIRFYEGEGLLAPRRLDNGYRDYSEEDARTLEKIKLLRQIGLDIDTIRRVQCGALTLEQALFSQTTKLEGDKAVIERAAEVCRELERSGVEYAALDPQPFLRQLEAPPAPKFELPPPAVPMPHRDDVPRACWHPWQRYFARALDMGLYDTLINAAFLLLTRDQSLIRIQANAIGGWICGLISLALTLALEPLWLHFWGWTPGKWVFGLKIRDSNGNKLTLAQGWRRSMDLGWGGYAWNVPILNLWTMWKCRKMGLDGRDCCWDGENDYRYTKEERRIHGGWFFAAAEVLSFALLLLAVFWSILPPCQGDLTVAEFSRNYEHFQNLLHSEPGFALPALDSEGRWSEEEDSGQTAQVLIDGEWVDEKDIATVWDQPEFTLDHGRVTAVTLHMESKDVVVSSGTRDTLVFFAMSGAVDGLNLFNYGLTDWAEIADQIFLSWEDTELDYRGLHVSQQVTLEGYGGANGYGMLWRIDGESQYCEKTVTISLIE